MRMNLVGLALMAVLSWRGSLWADPAFVRLAVDNGSVYVESSDPNTGPSAAFAIASLGKTFTAVAVLRLVERDVLDLDAQVADWVPAQVAADLQGLQGLRLHHLLSMSSGLPDYYTDDWLQAALEAPERFQTPAAAVRHASQEPLLFPPGRGFHYSNTNYVLLGLILEEATDKSYADVLREEVFTPAGLKDSFVFGSRPLPDNFARGHERRALVRRYYAGQGFGDGGIISSARDLVSFYDALLGKRRLISAPMLAKLQSDPFDVGYGMGLEVEDTLVGHAGADLGFSSDVRMNLKTGDIAVFLVAHEDADTQWPQDRLLQY